MRAGQVLLTDIEDLVAPGDAKIRILGVDLGETFDASLDSRKLGFKMTVGEEDKVEIVGA